MFCNSSNLLVAQPQGPVSDPLENSGRYGKVCTLWKVGKWVLGVGCCGQVKSVFKKVTAMDREVFVSLI